METAFYDKYGKPIAYLEDGDIYLFSGEPVAYLEGSSVYSFSGKHLGFYEEGWIRDNSGRYVFFTREARNGPGKPEKGPLPPKRLKHMKPGKGPKEHRSLPLLKSSAWSSLSAQQFFDIQPEAP